MARKVTISAPRFRSAATRWWSERTSSGDGNTGLAYVFTTGYTPTQISDYYGLNQVTFNGAAADGTGQTIALVELGGDPNLVSDLATFDAQEGLPAPPKLTIVAQDGSSNLPTPASDTEKSLWMLNGRTQLHLVRVFLSSKRKTMPARVIYGSLQ